MDKKQKLTPKQEMFCREYLIDLNGTQAAIRAGYSEKTANEQASRLLVNVNIQSYIAKLKSERQERVKIDADWVLRRAVEINERCMQREEIVSEDGKVLGFKFDSAGAIKSLDLIGKHVGVKAFDKEQEHVHRGELSLKVDFVSARKTDD